MNPRALRIRQITAADVDSVLTLANTLPSAPHWPRATWVTMLDPGHGLRRILLLAQDAETGALAGFAVAASIPPEAELESIAVSSEFQRQGVARALFEAVEAALRAAGVAALVLEVRPSNTPALALYRALGFADAGRRASYYADPEEDALVLRRELPGIETVA